MEIDVKVESGIRSIWITLNTVLWASVISLGPNIFGVMNISCIQHLGDEVAALFSEIVFDCPYSSNTQFYNLSAPFSTLWSLI